MTERQCIDVQNKLKNLVCTEDIIDIKNIKLIAGVDIAYWQEEGIEKAVCCIVVIDKNTNKVVEKRSCYGYVTFPYIPGCLAFRELPLFKETVRKIQSNVDLFIFDGNGVLHPRQMGLATHASFIINKPTIGVAKKFYKFKGIGYIEPKNREGAYKDIIFNDNTIGRILRTRRNIKPVFISVGNNISLDSATQLVMSLVGNESHIPIPTRLADIETHIHRRIAQELNKEAK